MFKWGYEVGGEYSKPYHLQFVCGQDDFNWYKSKIHKSCNLVISGYPELQNAKIKNNKFDSKFSGSLKEILFATGGCTPGMYSISELSDTLKFLNKFALKNTNITIKVKPHPCENISLLNSLIDKNKIPNLILLDKKINIINEINNSDLVLSKVSTVLFDSMIKQKPVISICSDIDDYFFNIMNPIVFTVNNHKKLIEKLNNLLDKAEYQKWKKSQLKSYKTYLERKISTNEHICNYYVAENVTKLIKSIDKKSIFNYQ